MLVSCSSNDENTVIREALRGAEKFQSDSSCCYSESEQRAIELFVNQTDYLYNEELLTYFEKKDIGKEDIAQVLMNTNCALKQYGLFLIFLTNEQLEKQLNAECKHHYRRNNKISRYRENYSHFQHKKPMDSHLIWTIIVLFPVLINFILLFNRKKKWVKSRYKWLVIILYSGIGAVLWLLEIEEANNDQKLLYWSFFVPLAFSLINYICMKLSYGIHKRDMYLWLKGSSDIDDRKFSGGKHVKASDRFFSIILLFSIFILPFACLFFNA